MDKIDVKLLTALEENSRISLKNLARELNVKTSTIYHRLHKLRESNILERYTIVVNPEKIGFNTHKLFSIRLKKMVIGKLDSMFLESFGKYISEQYAEILFASAGDDEQIHCIATFRDNEHAEQFLAEFQKNPYIDSLKVIGLSNIIKGEKLFQFIEGLLQPDERGEYFDDDEDEGENGDEDENLDEDEKEVFF